LTLALVERYGSAWDGMVICTSPEIFPQAREWRQNIWYTSGLKAMSRLKNIKPVVTWTILMCVVLVPFFICGERVNVWIDGFVESSSGNLAVLAVVLFAVLASDILLPVPSCLLSAMCGMFFGPFLGFAISFAAMEVSAFAGYFIGRSVSSLAIKMAGEASAKMEDVAVRGPFALFLMRPVPVLAECSCVYAGLRRYPIGRSSLWLSFGNAIVSAVYAAIGHRGRADDSFLPAFAAVVLLSGVFFACGAFLHRRRK
jgi:uncharacterized membrane protein YdjX (TVP38/TMEM64 family)